MNSGTISIRYARALFNYALENKVEDKVFIEMRKLSENFADYAHFRSTLDNPVLNVKDKLQLIKTAAGGNISDAFERFIQLVLHQKRETHLQTITLLYLDLYRKYKNITMVKVTTASPIDDITLEKIKQFIQKRETDKIEFETKIDTRITGGFILDIDSDRLDASISTQLRKIKEQLLSKNKKIA